MWIKNLYLSIITVVLFATCNAQVQGTYTNYTSTYYTATFHTSPNCPSTVAQDIYIDIPDGTTTSGVAIQENGNGIVNASNITGITVWLIPSQGGNGHKYVIPFCDGNGNPALSGSKQIGEPGFMSTLFTTILWQINTSNNTVAITIM